MLPVETHVRDSLDRKEAIPDLVKWIEVIRLDFGFVLQCIWWVVLSAESLCGTVGPSVGMRVRQSLPRFLGSPLKIGAGIM